MLLSVEGGGFFSSSAIGYSKGLRVLLLGQKTEERPMRVSPFQFSEQEVSADSQLASKGNQVSRGCASFVCFGCTSTGVNGPSPLKVGPESQTESLPSAVDACPESPSGNVVGSSRKACLRSSLKKPPSESPALPVQAVDTDDSLREESSSGIGCVESRKVQWTDACGKELVQIREFEVSDDDLSDDEFGQNIDRRCRCVIQ